MSAVTEFDPRTVSLWCHYCVIKVPRRKKIHGVQTRGGAHLMHPKTQPNKEKHVRFKNVNKVKSQKSTTKK